MDTLHYRPAPSPESITTEDRMVFPVRTPAVKLHLHLDEEPSPSSNPMEDSSMWMDALLDSAQERIDAMRVILDESDDEGPRAA